MLMVFLHSFVQMLFSYLYMPYAPEDYQNCFRFYELYYVLETLFPPPPKKSYLNQRKIITKILLKLQANIIRKNFPLF